MLTISFQFYRESSLSSLRGLGTTDNTPLTFAAASSPNTSIAGPIQVRRKEGGEKEGGGREEIRREEIRREERQRRGRKEKEGKGKRRDGMEEEVEIKAIA